jgi:cation diffusion facilitator family transporter
MAAPTDAGLEHGVRLRAGRLALVGGIAVLLTKFAAWRITDSTAVLSDALESFVNVAAGALLLASLYLSAQPADRNHPYGHGKVEFFSAGVEGTLIAIAAGMVAVTAV